MKRFLILTLALSVGALNGIGYYDKYQPQVEALRAARSGAGSGYNTAASDAALKKAQAIDTSKVPSVYADSVKKLKEAIIVIIKSVKVIVPKLVDLGKQTARGGVTGLAKGVVTLGVDSATRNAIIDLTKTIIATVDVVKKLSKADASTKQTVKSLLTAVTEDADVKKVLSIVGSVPVVGDQLKDALTKLITLNF